jgi:hypothetical protein
LVEAAADQDTQLVRVMLKVADPVAVVIHTLHIPVPVQ